MKRKVLNILVMLLLTTGVMSFSFPQNRVVPDEYKTKVNPYKGDQSLKMIGLRNYNRHCVSCHGKTGVGDGVMAKNLKTSPGDLTAPELHNLNDGELYYLSFIGVEERPDFMKLIPDEEEKWAVINHVRTLLKE